MPLIDSTALSGSAEGRDRGLQAVFSVGYNVVFGSWLIGAQMDASWNRNKDVVTRLQGTNFFQRSNLATFSVPQFNNSTQSSNAGVEDYNLVKNWTGSLLARGGYFVTPRTLVYGGLGWSVSGFDLVNNFNDNALTGGCAAGGPCTFTLKGFTWTAGLEQDFGGWRGFLQVKGVSYRGKDVTVLGPNNGSFTSTVTTPGATGTVTGTQGSTDVRHVSASTLEFNAGVTIPLGVAFNFWRR